MADYVHLVPKVSYQGQALAVDAAAGQAVTVQILNSTTHSQQWLRGQEGGGYTFKNRATGQYLCANSVNGQATTVGCVNALSIWTTGSGSDYVALRPQFDSNQNLNVRGDGPYAPGTAVLTYKWGGGKGNEIWKMQPVGVEFEVAEEEVVGAAS